MAGFRAFDGVLLSASMGTLLAVLWMTRQAYKQMQIHVFTFLILALICPALFVRAFFFLIDINHQDFDSTDHKNPNDQSPKMFAFLWTYPIMNNILAAYMISLRWDSDYKLMQMPATPEIYRRFRLMMNSFVGIVIILLSCLYLVYMVSLPTDLGDELGKLFKFLAIFNWIIGAITGLMAVLYVKKMYEDLPLSYTKAVAVESFVWVSAQIGSGVFCFWLGSGGAVDLIKNDREGGHSMLYGVVLTSVFLLTEFIPALTFAFTLNRWAKIRFARR